MQNLQLIKSEKFGEITADIYSDDNDLYMTAQQLGECLEYSDPIRAINKLASRNEYLKENSFSVVVNLTSTDGKSYDTRVFNEDGIYEIAFLASTEKAKEFREWVRGVLKALRKGEFNKTYSAEDIMIYQLEEQKKIKYQLSEQQKQLDTMDTRIDGMKEVIALNPTAWREGCRKLIVRISEKMGGHEYIRNVQADIYELIDARAGCSLKTRLTNKRYRMADEGVCKSKLDKLNKVDIIADDKKLIEIYIAIVKEMAMKYDVTVPNELDKGA